MNELVKILQKDDFPALFELDDLYALEYDKTSIMKMFDEAMKNKWICCVYGGIYTLGLKYTKGLFAESIAQKIVPDSYASLHHVLSKESWIPEAVFTTTSVTEGESCTINTNGYGKYSYRKLYDKYNDAGIYTVDEEDQKYKIAMPLRALCDLIRLYNDKWNSVDEICDTMRIEYDNFESLAPGDFDELQGTFNIGNIETMLTEIRRDLKL